MLFTTLVLLVAGGIALLVSVMLFFWVIGLRRVVPVNEVHIVQNRKSTISYGKGFESNTYYE